MRLSIRMKIFLPVMLLLIAFPLAAWFVFRYTIEDNMNYMARRDLERFVRAVEHAIEGIGPEGGPPFGDDRDSDDILLRLRVVMRMEKGESRLLAMDAKYRVLYPKNYDGQPETAQIYSDFLMDQSQETGQWRKEEIRAVDMDRKRYLTYFLELTGEDDQKARYVILYCPVHGTEAVMDQMSRLVLTIMAVMAGISILIFWFVAGSISGPVRRLCEAARGIGDKRFQKVKTGATVRELCELEREINSMQEKLLQADQAERTFFQNASHELRTPLMSISGYAQGIQCGVFEDVSQAAGIILEESSRLTEVVDGILTLTRMDQMRYELVMEEISVEEFIEVHLEKLAGIAISRMLRLEFEREEPDISHTVIADGTLLERAFMNVASNCIRYAREEILVSVRAEEEMIQILIKDDGPGITSREIERLFDRFYKGKDGNHGLGLAIAKSSLEYMGGEVTVCSGSSGSEFTITLPQDCRSFAVESSAGI